MAIHIPTPLESSPLTSESLLPTSLYLPSKSLPLTSTTTPPPSETTTITSPLPFILINAGDITQSTFTNSSRATAISQSPNAITTPSPTSSHTTTSPTSVPIKILEIEFEPPSLFIACSPSVINWNYTGEPTSVMTLMVDNYVPQDVPPFSFINKTLSSQIDPTSGSFLWPSVNVPQGWYQLRSSLPLYGQVNQPSMFFVKEGTDTSCFIPIEPARIVDDIDPTAPTHTGAIAGGTIGGIVIMFGLCIGYLYVYRRRRNPQSSISSCIKEIVAHLRPAFFDLFTSVRPKISQNPEKTPQRGVNASDSPYDQEPRSTALVLDGPPHLEQAVASTYSLSGSLLRSIDSYPNPSIDGHFTPRHAPSYAEGYLSPRSSSWSFAAVSQPYARVLAAEPMPYSPENTLSYAASNLSPRASSWSFTAVSQPNARASAVDTMPYSTQDAGSDHSTFSTPSTAPPLYRSPTTTSTLPPSFRTSDQSIRNIDHLL